MEQLRFACSLPLQSAQRIDLQQSSNEIRGLLSDEQLSRRGNATGNQWQLGYVADMEIETKDKVVTFARLIFWAALAFTLMMATLPQPPQVIEAPDKYQHALAFFALTALHKLAYREFGFWKRVFVMAFLGGAIEVVQMVPALHRDAEWMDWVADVVAILAASIAVMALFPARKSRGD